MFTKNYFFFEKNVLKLKKIFVLLPPEKYV